LNLVFIGLAAVAGALARYGISPYFAGGNFPWGTLLVNILGCFLAGIVWNFNDSRLYVAAMVGFLGSFTTFSAFSLETNLLFSRTPAQGIAYVCASIIGCQMAVLAGVFCGKLGSEHLLKL